ncbi:MAG TPA: GAF and ANTAR domain-containing protein [Pseudonocardia sp.]|jgi:GAF domain-containing protein|nr:GAF and ANTAR domain-containing protein [Pseudonocardia sp.]
MEPSSGCSSSQSSDPSDPSGTTRRCSGPVDRLDIRELAAALRASDRELLAEQSREPEDVADSLLRGLIGAEGTEEFLAEVARAAVAAMPAAVACGVSVAATEWSRLLGATSDDLAERMDGVQYDLQDGPCLSALRVGVTVPIDDIAADGRWPDFVRQAGQEGVGASLSVPMLIGGRAVGALNLYAREAHAFSSDDRIKAHGFADRAAGAVAIGLLLADREEHARSLERALGSRATIDKAIGIVMATAGVGETEAFDILRLRSQHGHIKLRDLAQRVVTELTETTEEIGDEPG